jgi:CubicO group peptidase (beta-lactamase class C family)
MPRRLAIAALSLAGWLLIPSATPAQQTATKPDRETRSTAATATRADPLRGLDAYIESAMKDWEIPGLAIGIVKDDRLVYSRGFGVRELGKPEKVTARTMFALASNSKAFTATALGLLVSEGKLNWDDPASKYLPWFQMHDPYATRELTVRDLLCHRCGLGTWQGDLMWYGSDLSRREVLERVKFIEPEFSFRAKFGYCNLAFVAAGEILPAITGLSWEDFLKRRFFEPMGMSRTNTDLRATERLDDVARPHTLIKGKVVPIAYRSLKNSAPAGAINSCVEDWSQWIRLQINEGKLDGKTIIPARIVNETRTPQTFMGAAVARGKLQFSAYGLGWMLREYHGRLLVMHSGGMDGMLSLTIIVPEERLGVVVLTNHDEQEFYGLLPYHVIDAYLGVASPDRSPAMLKARKERTRRERDDEEKDRSAGTSRPSLEPSGYAGVYHHPVLGKATISVKDGKLFIEVERNPGLAGELKHRKYDTFRVEWADSFLRASLLPFRLDEDGRAIEFRMKVRPDFVDPMEYRFTRKP